MDLELGGKIAVVTGASREPGWPSPRCAGKVSPHLCSDEKKNPPSRTETVAWRVLI